MNEEKFRVLAIDDKPRIRKSLRILLENNNFIVYTAENSDTTFERLKQHEIDVVLCDIKFENEEGAETGLKIFRYIREKYSQIPIIMVTVIGESKTKIKFLEEGALFYVTKPWIEKELITYINMLAEKKRFIKIINQHAQKMIDTSDGIVKIIELIDEIKNLRKTLKTDTDKKMGILIDKLIEAKKSLKFTPFWIYQCKENNIHFFPDKWENCPICGNDIKKIEIIKWINKLL